MPAAGSAVVGTGFIGPVHIEALRRLGRPVVGILASSPQKSEAAATKLQIPKAYQSYEALLADPEVAVVHLTSPNRWHFVQCKQAIQAGKHVICEKPLAMNIAETTELTHLAQIAPLVTAVCYNIRFYPLCLEARQRIVDGQIGKIYHVTGSYVQDWLLFDTDFNWRVLADEGGALRAVADIGTHWLDLIQSVTGLGVEKVCADLQTLIPTRKRPTGSVETFQSKMGQTNATQEVNIDTEDYGSVLLRFQPPLAPPSKGGGKEVSPPLEGGARGGEFAASGCFTVSQVTAGRKNCVRFEIAGSKGSLAWNSERPNELWLGHRDKPNELLIRDPALLQQSVRPFANYPGGHNEGFPDTFKQLFRAIYDYIDAGDWKAPRPFPTFADGHKEVLLCEAILQSHREGKWVAV